jgi:hypothetical protein
MDQEKGTRWSCGWYDVWFASDRLLQLWILEVASPGINAIVGILYIGACAGFEVGGGNDLLFCPITA